MAWKLFQVSNGHKSLENFELEAADVPAVLYQLKGHFQKRLDAGSKVGLEVLSAAAAEVWIDGSKLTVGWDNWSGLSLWHGMQTGIVLSGKSKDICSRR